MGAKFGHKVSKETRNKIRLSKLGQKHTEESKRKLSESIKGEKHPMYGKHHTEKTKQKMRLAKIGTKQSAETIRKRFLNARGEKHYNWKGGRYKDQDGYILVLQKNHPYADSEGYIREHRLVMEKKLGRYLARHEEIHHINEIKDDNCIENLELLTTLEHMKYHTKNRKRSRNGRFL